MLNYTRIVPRDLFNESKLLKCLGQLALLIHDGVDKNGRATPGSLEVHHDETDEFRIGQRQCSGDFYCDTVGFVVRDTRSGMPRRLLDLRSSLNSREPYPLICTTKNDEISVFNGDGTLSDNFLAYISDLDGTSEDLESLEERWISNQD